MLRFSAQKSSVSSLLCLGAVTLAGCGFGNEPSVATGKTDAPAPQATAIGSASTEAKAAAIAATLPPPPAEPAEDVLAEQTIQRVADLVRVRDALEKYAVDHGGAYPISNGDAQGYHSQWGAALGPVWIPELVPNYVTELPRDPSGAIFSNGPMYLYMSDGKAYKLIAHGVPKCSSAKLSDGVAIDPARSTGPDNCWAFGVWSAGGEKL